MTDEDFKRPNFKDLPDHASVFPLAGALLLPGGFLPLNIFEQRYLDMVRASMEGNRIIVMCQPRDADSGRLYNIASAGCICHYQELSNERIVLTLKGICRCHLGKEIFQGTSWRVFESFWDDFKQDYQPPMAIDIDREHLIKLVQFYFQKRNISANWSALETGSNEALVTALSMVCPFETSEKQALLETKDIKNCARVLFSLLTISNHDLSNNGNALLQ